MSEFSSTEKGLEKQTGQPESETDVQSLRAENITTGETDQLENDFIQDLSKITMESEAQIINEEEVRALAAECKNAGNQAFAAELYDEAIESYTLAILELIKIGSRDHLLLGNRSAAYLALKRYVPALRDAQLAAEENPTWWKAHWRMGLALMGMVPKKFRTEQAIKAFEACRQCPGFPQDKQQDVQIEVQKALARLQQQESEVSMPENCLVS